jgi:hypothetical protein
MKILSGELLFVSQRMHGLYLLASRIFQKTGILRGKSHVTLNGQTGENSTLRSNIQDYS